MSEPLFQDLELAIKCLDELYAHCIDTFRRKNRGYADTKHSKDVLENFRSEAADNGVSMLKYTRILRGKHEKAWKTFVNRGYSGDKPWRILKDRINYAFLEYLIALDNNLFSRVEVVSDTGENA